MRVTVLAVALFSVMACGGGDDPPAGPDSSPLAMTTTAVDAERTALATLFNEPALRALIPGTPNLQSAVAASRPVHDHPAILDPGTMTVVPPSLRGRLFVSNGMTWTGSVSPSAPANGTVITMYESMPFGGGPAVGTLTIIDSTAGALGVASVTLRNVSGAVLLRARITESQAPNRIIGTATIGTAPNPTATLADTFDISASRVAGRMSIGATGGQWFLGQPISEESRLTAELVSRGAVLRAVTEPVTGGDSTSFRLDGRFLGYFKGDTVLRAPSNTNAPALVSAFARFAGNAPLPNFLSLAVSTILLIVIDTTSP